MLFLGAHCNSNGGIHMAARRAGRGGMSALQIFTAVPKYYNERVSIRGERVERFRESLQVAGIELRNVLVHAGYVLNVATLEDEKWERAAAALAKELERSTLLGAGAVCFHPGSAGKGNKAESIKRVARAMTLALQQVQGETRLLIENTAGAGNTMGRTEQEVAAMLQGIPDDLRPRAGYGLDSCHLFASGYDIHRSPDRLREILDSFERETGEKPGFFHLNDSEGALGSNRDRHATIGAGAIGAEAFGWLLKDMRASGVPLILETPHLREDVADDDDSPDENDVEALRLLRSME